MRFLSGETGARQWPFCRDSVITRSATGCINERPVQPGFPVVSGVTTKAFTARYAFPPYASVLRVVPIWMNGEFIVVPY